MRMVKEMAGVFIFGLVEINIQETGIRDSCMDMGISPGLMATFTLAIGTRAKYRGRGSKHVQMELLKKVNFLKDSSILGERRHFFVVTSTVGNSTRGGSCLMECRNILFYLENRAKESTDGSAETYILENGKMIG